MSKSRAFSGPGIQEKVADYHGTCRYVRTSPDIAANGVKSVNIELTFEEALRFATAIQSAVLNLNRYNRNKKDGREMGLCLSLKTQSTAISVIEMRVRPPAG
jgi:hypothetical protein